MTRPTEPSVICPVLVGREGALDSARTVLDRARRSVGGLLLVAGEAGIGKSRILRETIAGARERGFVVLRGACFEADRTSPLAPLLDLVREYSATVSSTATAHVFAPAAAELVRAFPELSSMFVDLPQLEALDPGQEKRRLFHAIGETVVLLGRTQPVLIVVEDVHWGDEATLDLLLHLVRRISNQPVALVASFRSDEIEPPLERLLAEIDRTRIATELNLSRFSTGELAAMLAAIFDGGAPGGGFAESMHALTEGNPFFVEEVLKSLLSTGEVSRRADGTWQARLMGSVQAPRTAVEAVRRRLSALSVPARDVASMAAVAGRRFDFALLQTLTGQDERELVGHIRELIGAQLVTEESTDRFAFRHALTREAIVGELLARERVVLHRAVADALEQQGGPVDAYIESLAYHAHSARDWHRALKASTRAADHALSLAAPREALIHLDRAIDAANQAGIEPDGVIHLARGRALEILGDLQGAHAEFSTALDGARNDGRDRDAWESLHALGMLWAARDYARAGEYRREALVQARGIGDASLIARSLNRVANWHVNLEQPAPALRGHAEALTLFESLGDRRGVAETVDLLAMTHFIAGNLVESSRTYERAVLLHECNGDRRAMSGALALLCLCDSSTHASSATFGRTAIAQEVVQGDRPMRLAREIGWRAGDAFALYLLGDSLGWQGEYQRALPYIRESLAIAEDMEHLQWQCGASRALGMIMLELQAPELARIPLERAHNIALRLGSQTWTRWTAAPLVIALAQLGEHKSALAILDEAVVPSQLGREALRPGDEDSPTLGERYLALARAEVALAMGNPSLALDIVDARLEVEEGAVPRLTFIRARALLMCDDDVATERALLQSQSDAVATNAKPLLWRIHVAIGQLRKKQRRRAESRQAFDDALVVTNELMRRIDDTALRASFERTVHAAIPTPPTPTSKQKVKEAFGGLTSRERDVARLIAQGKANRSIARVLGIGERTVESYVAAALAKLDFSTRTQLAAWTVQREMSKSITGS